MTSRLPHLAARWLFVCLAGALALFSVFGFMASGEAGVGPGWRIGYALLAVLSVGVGLRSLRSLGRRT